MEKLENIFYFLISLFFYPLFLSSDFFYVEENYTKRANLILKENWEKLVGKKE